MLTRQVYFLLLTWTTFFVNVHGAQQCQNYWTADNEFKIYQKGRFKLSGRHWPTSFAGFRKVNGSDRIVIWGKNWGRHSGGNPAAIVGGFRTRFGLKTNTRDWKCAPRTKPLHVYMNPRYNFEADRAFTTPLDLGAARGPNIWARYGFRGPIRSWMGGARWIWCRNRAVSECICVARKNTCGRWRAWGRCVRGYQTRIRVCKGYCHNFTQRQRRRCARVSYHNCPNFWTADNEFRIYQLGRFKLAGRHWPTNFAGYNRVNGYQRIIIWGKNWGRHSGGNPAAIVGGFQTRYGLKTNTRDWRCAPRTKPLSVYFNARYNFARDRAFTTPLDLGAAQGPNIWARYGFKGPIRGMRGARWIWCRNRAVAECICVSIRRPSRCTYGRWSRCVRGWQTRLRRCQSYCKVVRHRLRRRCTSAVPPLNCPNFWTADNEFRIYQAGRFKLAGRHWPTSFSGFNKVNGFQRIVIWGKNWGRHSGGNPAAIVGGFRTRYGLKTNTRDWKCAPRTKPLHVYMNARYNFARDRAFQRPLDLGAAQGPNIWARYGFKGAIRSMRGARWIWCRNRAVAECICVSIRRPTSCTYGRWGGCVRGYQYRYKRCRNYCGIKTTRQRRRCQACRPWTKWGRCWKNVQRRFRYCGPRRIFSQARRCNIGRPIRQTRGYLEILNRGIWRPVCDDHWNIRASRVVCRQLRKPTGNPRFVRARAWTNAFWLDDVRCNGRESRLDQCRHRGFGRENCNRHEAFRIICRRGSPTHALRQSRGYLEINHRGIWRPVCDDHWNRNASKVVCRQLGLSTRNPRFVRRRAWTNAFWLDDVRCTGRESKLTQCRHRGFGRENCGRHEAFQIICR